MRFWESKAPRADLLVILDRIAASDRSTAERIERSEAVTSERLMELKTEVASLTAHVGIQNGRVGKAEDEILLLKDRREQAGIDAASKTSLRHVVYSTFAGVGAVTIVTFILYAAGVHS